MKRLDEVAATSDARDVGHLHAEQPGALAVEVDVDRRIIERLAELHVAQRRDRRERSAQLLRDTRGRGRLGPLTATSIGVGEPKLITRLTMSLGSKENRTSGQLLRRTLAAAAP